MKCLECKGEKGLCSDGDEGTSIDCNEHKSENCNHIKFTKSGNIHRGCNRGSKLENGCAEFKDDDGEVIT